MDNIITTKQLSKNYRLVQALKEVDLQIPRGSIVGLLGKNGAGKSTLLKCIMGLLKYDGEIDVFGRPLEDWKHDIYGRVAFIPDVSGLDPRLTVQQTIDYVASVNDSWNWDKADRLFAKSNLPCSMKVSCLSKGMKTKLYLLLTLAKDVDVLILDEPTLGLDIVFREEFYNLLLGEFFTEEKTVIISTHQVAEVENILQDVIFIDEGRIVLHERVEALKERWHIYEVPVAQKDQLEEYAPKLMTHTLGRVRGLVEGKAVVENAQSLVPSLSEIFMAVTNK